MVEARQTGRTRTVSTMIAAGFSEAKQRGLPAVVTANAQAIRTNRLFKEGLVFIRFVGFVWCIEHLAAGATHRYLSFCCGEIWVGPSGGPRSPPVSRPSESHCKPASNSVNAWTFNPLIRLRNANVRTPPNG